VELLEKKVDQLTSQLAVLTGHNGPTLPEIITLLTDQNLGLSCNPNSNSADIGMLLEAAKNPAYGICPPTSSVLEGQPSIMKRGLMSKSRS
jgi:hypothetical protein